MYLRVDDRLRGIKRPARLAQCYRVREFKAFWVSEDVRLDGRMSYACYCISILSLILALV
jgi:hypothetical protein